MIKEGNFDKESPFYRFAPHRGALEEDCAVAFFNFGVGDITPSWWLGLGKMRAFQSLGIDPERTHNFISRQPPVRTELMP